MPFEKKVALPGSERTPVSGAHETGPVDQQEPIQVTVVLRRRDGSIDQDLALVQNFAAHHGLTVVSQSAPARNVILSGTPAALEQAFGTRLAMFHVASTGVTYRGRTGSVLIPAELEPAVLAVLGLDSRPIAKPHFRVAAHATPAGALSPIQVAQLYSFPAGRTGAGQTVAIIELGGGYRTEDLDAYFSSLGLKTPSVSAVPVDGAANQPGSDADGEVMLDIEVVGAIAPKAAIAVYFAPNTDQGFFDAVTAAAHDSARKPSVISISWGASEDSWTAQARDSLNAAFQDAASLGITVTVASGDDGSADGLPDGKVHVDFPSSSPFVLSCGGTRLNAKAGKIASEVVWNETASKEGATGGGVSRYFALPSYQSNAAVPKHPETGFVGRGVPDVAGDADPNTGYIVRVNGAQAVIGGTSAVAPLWAALAALANEGSAARVGYWNAALYKAPAGSFHDILTGNNGFYHARAKWDPCTGLGTPIGSSLAKAPAKRSSHEHPVT